MKVALVGCGQMSRGWLDACAKIDDLEIVALVDLDLAAAKRQAAAFELADVLCGTDLAAVLEATHPDIVFDVTVPAARHGVVETAIGHGCHVLTEKPMATSLADARHFIDLAAAKGRVHAVVQNRRFLAGIRRLRRFVESGAIGALTAVHCDFFIGPHFGGFREDMDHVLLLDMAIHTFDAARYVSGAVPKAVYCHETNPKGSWYRTGAAANAIFEMSGGVVLTYRGSWAAEGLRTSWESVWRLVGENGTLTWDGADGFAAERPIGRTGLLSEETSIEIPPLDPGDRIGGHEGVIRDFLDALRGGRTPECPGTDNIRSLAMVLGAIRSAETGHRVTYNDVMELSA
ncbi:Gfo/Idh/MocA family protein [Lichenifustis flavocetrariae]|uniref:Gfo/Idh/MocA family oxidoreductase n=1 Tax=Lichenifustis flavocetrariae TaxID=2949735 RepID=A0AA41YZ46_9HYPH|nr:Gfo/Idh/MocA family oxidoreductase [Lichenifustis flavocetrariae]MCW6507480.1 Gfo/Idh/MocA family oxidoreductase [Lichenifustis flavocetrariae]